MRPQIAMRVGGTPPARTAMPLSALRLNRSLHWPVGQAIACLPPGTRLPEPGEPVSIAGSSDGDPLSPLFTGNVLVSRPSLLSGELLIEEFTGPLTRLHLWESFTQTTAAKVMVELCQRAGIKGALVEPPGAPLPFLALMYAPSAMDHLLKLASMSGQMVRPCAGGRLHIGMPPMLPTPVIIRPQDAVIDWRMEEAGGADATHVHRLTFAGIPPADLGEIITLQGFPTGNGPVRIFQVDVEYSAGTGLLTTLELHRLGG